MKESIHSLERSSIWAIRDTWPVLPPRTIVQAGNALAFVTLLLRVHDGTGEPWAVVSLLACFSVPTIATIGIAGRLADRHDSRMLLAIGLGLQLLAAVGLALDGRVITTLVMVLLFETGQALVAPVWAGLLPRVVGEERLGQAIAWQQGLAALAGPAGGALGGFLYQWYGGHLAFWLTAAAIGVLVVAALVLPTRRHVASEADTPETDQRWSAGNRIVRADALIWPLFVALLVMVVLVEGVNAGEVFLARDALGATPIQYGLGEIAAGVGGVVGAALAGRLASEASRVRGCLAGFGAACAAIAAAGVAPDYWVYFVLIVILAGGAGVGNAASGALIMLRTPDADRGKVQSALSGMARAASLLALALGGAAVTWLRPRVLFVAAGVAGLTAVAVAASRLIVRRRGPEDG